MFENIKRKIRDFGFTRLHRIERYIFYINETTKITSKNDAQLVEDINELIELKKSKVKTASTLLIISYLGVYFSFVSFILNDFFLLAEVTILINKVISFFGTTLFLIGIVIFTNLKDLYFQDLQLLSSQLIAIYTKYHTQEDQHFFKKNSYKAFIDFYKR